MGEVGIQRRRVETATKRGDTSAKPQWQNLFLAPAYQEGFVDDESAEPMFQAPPIPGRRRLSSHPA